MGKIVLVTGGARSGKSSFAESKLLQKEGVCYIATGLVMKEDPEWQERVKLHQERRPQSWDTLEQYRDLATWIEQDDHGDYLVDCATMLTTNRLFDLVNEWYPEKGYLSDEQFLSKAEQARILEAMEAEWSQILSAMKERQATFWIVTNEVGLGIVPDTRLGRYFRDLQGRVNQLIAKEASEVYLVICGLAQQLK
jgi:adenosylcobinamide kinase / adenosylcobinamide phosphate guanyltransferase, putative